MKITKKCWPELFQDIADGRKTFDVRLADFDAKAGDILVLREWDPETRQYTGRLIEKRISYVLRTRDLRFWPKEEVERHGLQVLSLRD